jgi:hypothetical protein
MVAFVNESPDNFLGSIIGVSDEIAWCRQAERIDQQNHFVQQCSLIVVVKENAFVDSGSQRNGKDRSAHAGQDGDRLTGMPHDVVGLGVRIRFLMQALDGRHLLA